jgi:hypothetical protein
MEALTEEEKIRLRNVYRGSVSLYNVRIIDGWAGLATVTTRSPTLGFRIYMRRRLTHARQVGRLRAPLCRFEDAPQTRRANERVLALFRVFGSDVIALAGKYMIPNEIT